MNKIIILVIVLILCSTLVWLWIAKSNQTASSEPVTQSSSEEFSYADRDDTVVLTEEQIEAFQAVADDMKQVLLAAPDDLTGKKSAWYKKLTECQVALNQAAKTGTRKDLFATIPPTATFLARDRESEDLHASLGDLRHRLEVSGVPIIKEIAKVVTENNGTLDAATAELAVKVFSVRGFKNEPDWEDEIDGLPINAAGVLIAQPEIMPLLEVLPIEQLDIFVSGDTPEIFFRRYVQDAEGTPKRDRRYYGMPILRQRYSENRVALHESFNKLAAKVAPYRAKLYGEEQE